MIVIMTMVFSLMVTGCMLVTALVLFSQKESRRELRRIAAVRPRHLHRRNR